MKITRRRFGQSALIVSAAAALGFSFFEPAEANTPAKIRVPGPQPINDGPAPPWEDFHYIVKVGVPYNVDGSWIAGWMGYWQGHQYGEYVTITDVYDGDILAEVQILLKEQADQVRHQLIKDTELPCFCTMCKAQAIMRAKETRLPKWLAVTTTMNEFPNYPGPAEGEWLAGKHWYGSTVRLQGKGKGWVRAAKLEANRELHKMIMSLDGPTNGY